MSAMEKHLADMEKTKEAYNASREEVLELLTDIDRLGGTYLDRAGANIERMKNLSSLWHIQTKFYYLLRDEKRERESN